MPLPIRRGVGRLRHHGILSFLHGSLNHLGVWKPVWNTLTSRYPYGTNVFELDWDLLIVLDACRVDSLRTVSESYPWMGDVGQICSVGSMSAEWVLQTFTDRYRDEISQTALVTENIWTHRILHDRVHEQSESEVQKMQRGFPYWRPVTPETFAHYELISPKSESISHESLHPDDPSAPHIVTDRAIAVGREVEFKRLIVHYMLPHLNFIADALAWNDGNISDEELMRGPSPTRSLREEEMKYPRGSFNDGTESVDRYKELYHQNLRLALRYVDVLRHNIDAETVVITSDHGESFGERGVWNHPYGYPFTPLRNVPWATVTASNEQTYDPQYQSLDGKIDEESQLEHLRQLGYI